MMKKFILEIKIDDFLNDIEEYCENATEYLSNPYTKFEKDDIIKDLSSVSEIIKFLKEMIDELEMEYENEQLQ